MNKTRKIQELEKMERVWCIFTHPFYIQNLKKNKECETERIFCKHDMAHFLDVARLAYILNLERNCRVEKEMIYATALLHDVGKWRQYEVDTEKESRKENWQKFCMMRINFPVPVLRVKPKRNAIGVKKRKISR